MADLPDIRDIVLHDESYDLDQVVADAVAEAFPNPYPDLIVASGGVRQEWFTTFVNPVVTQTADISPTTSATFYTVGTRGSSFIVDFLMGFAPTGDGTATGPILIDITTFLTVLGTDSLGNIYGQTLLGSFAGKVCPLVHTTGKIFAPQTPAGVNLGATQTLATADAISISGRIYTYVD